MKPIKILLLCCVFFMGALGVKGQVNSLPAPITSPAASGTLCVGTTFTATLPALTAPNQTGCDAVVPILELLNSGGAVLASNFNATTTLGTGGPITLTIPPTAATTFGNYLRYRTNTLGCAATGASSTTFSVDAIGPEPTGVTNFESVCHTAASAPLTLTPSGSCPANYEKRLYFDNTTVGGGVTSQPSNKNVAPGVYNYYVGCEPLISGCATAPANRKLSTFEVLATPAGVAGALKFGNGCVNVMPSLSVDPCPVGQTAFLMKGAPGGTSLLQASDYATPGTLDLFVGCDNGTCKTELGQGVAVTGGSGSGNTYTVNAVPTLTGETVQTSSQTSSPAVASTTATICVLNVTQGVTVANFAGACSAGDRTIWASMDATTPLTGTVFVDKVVGKKDYYVSCLFGTCESPRKKVTVDVTPAGPVPQGVQNFATVCGTVASNPLTLTPTGTCDPGYTLKMYADTLAATVGTLTQGSNKNVTPGVYNFYLGCEPTANDGTCPTAPGARVKATFEVLAPVAGVAGALKFGNGCVNVMPSLSVDPCPTGQTAFLMVGASGSGGTKLLEPSDYATPGAIYLFVGCETATCKTEFGQGVAVSGPDGNRYTVNAIPTLTGETVQTSSPTSSPAVASTTATICIASVTQGVTVANFTGACSAGDRTIWASMDATTPLTGTVFVDKAVGTKDYYVSCLFGTCESPRKKVSVIVTENGPVPQNVTDFASVCKTTSSVSITLSPTGTCPADYDAKIYTDKGSSIGVLTQGANSNVAVGTYYFYIGCEPKAGTNGCPTAPADRKEAKFVVNRTPAPVAAITPGTVCSGIQDVTISYTSGCMATDSVQVWSATSAGVPLMKLTSGIDTTFYTTKLTNPSSTVDTPFYFVVRCKTSAGCSAVSSVQTVVVKKALQVTDASITPSARCANVPTTAMFFNSNCGSAVTVWYTQEFGGTPVATLPNTTPTTVGTHTWWAACNDGNGCESPRKRVDFVVYPAGSVPGTGSTVSLTTTTGGATHTLTVTQSKTICGVTGDAITFSGCSAGEILKVRVNGDIVDMPTIIADGVERNYSVICEAGTGAAACPSQPSGVIKLTVYPVLTVAPTASVVPKVVCSASAPVPFGGSSSCGVLATVWFDATTNTQLLSLPAMTPTTPGTYSYYAKCMNGGGCMSPASAVTSITVVGNSTAPTITSVGGTEVCTGVNVTLTTNCPAGSVVKWSTGAEGNALPLVSNVPQVRAVTAKCVTTVEGVSCESPVSATTTVVWKTFDITIINIGSPLSGVKPGSNVPKSAWAANFVTVDAGPSLQSSSQGNPSVFFTENPNKGADRFWTVHVESCALGTAGAISYDMLVTPEAGVPYSYNTVENNAPYLMYANRDGFTELYAHNHGAYGFTSEPKYTQGLPKGLYKLSIRYWSEKGMGLYPAVRTAQGTQLAYQEYWFRIQSQNGIGSGAAREGVTESTETPFVTMGQNPVTRTLSLTINGAKGQDVKLNLVDASGRSIKVSSVTPETNTHREEIDMTSQNTGMYFIQVSTPSKRAALKVLKVSQD